MRNSVYLVNESVIVHLIIAKFLYDEYKICNSAATRFYETFLVHGDLTHPPSLHYGC